MIKIGTTELSNIMIGETQVQKMYLGTNLIWEYNSGRLPSGYKELEYIASTKTGGQYIDLNILLYDTLNKNYDIAIKFNPIGAGSDSTTQGTIFGCQDNTGSPWPGTFIRVSGTNMVGRYIGGSSKDNTLGKLGNDIELTEKTSPSKNVYNYNNSGKTHTWGTSLFCIFNNQAKTARIRYIEAKLYYFKLFVEGTLVRDMIPCINPSNVVGLYDLANDVFYSSPNGVAFVAGPEISNQEESGEGGEGGSTESNLVALDYIQAANNGIIDLKYIPTTGAEVTVQVSNLNTALLNKPSGINNLEIIGLNTSTDNFNVQIDTGNGSSLIILRGFGFNELDEYYLTNNIDGLHTIKLSAKLYIDDIGGDIIRSSSYENSTITLSLFDNSSIRYHSLTIKKANGTTITLKPYSNNGKAVLYDETNKVVYAPTSGDYICGNPLS